MAWALNAYKFALDRLKLGFFDTFDSLWGANKQIVCVRHDKVIIWKRKSPRMGLLY